MTFRKRGRVALRLDIIASINQRSQSLFFSHVEKYGVVPVVASVHLTSFIGSLHLQLPLEFSDFANPIDTV
jgi:hypothetical protein